MDRTVFGTENGCPVGVIGYGRFTTAERIAFLLGDTALREAIRAARASMPPVRSMAEIYGVLFSAEVA